LHWQFRPFSAAKKVQPKIQKGAILFIAFHAEKLAHPGRQFRAQRVFSTPISISSRQLPGRVLLRIQFN